MNPIIKKQLDSVQSIDLPEYNESTTHLVIQKVNKISNDDINVGDCYMIEVANYIINPPENFDLHTNWNGGIKPVYKHMKCAVTRIMGKMIKVDATYFDLNTGLDIGKEMWSGWLPLKSIKIIRRI